MEFERKGARSLKDIPNDVLQHLNQGKISSVNLTEWLAVDQTLLLKNILKEHSRESYLKPVLSAVESLKNQTVNTVNKAIGAQLYRESINSNDEAFFEILSQHTSDMVRCWAVYTIINKPFKSVSETLHFIQVFAADQHFGVREIAWMAVRPLVAAHLEEALLILENWTIHEDENVRRFATEVTRPRGVWCEHIEELKQTPEMAVAILEALRADSSLYVQNSVANWLNDASKTRPDFVQTICERWNNESPVKATAYIVKRALRTLHKK